MTFKKILDLSISIFVGGGLQYRCLHLLSIVYARMRMMMYMYLEVYSIDYIVVVLFNYSRL